MRVPKRHTNPRTGETYWRVRYRRDGAQRALAFYGPTAKVDATEFCRLLDTLGADRAVAWHNQHLDDEPGDQGATLAEWWPRYLASLTGITSGTRDAYDRMYRRVWDEPLGSMPLTAITREDIARVVNALSKKRADKTVANAYGVLTSCLRVALLDGLIPALPTKGIRLPRRTEHERDEMRFLTHEEWRRIELALPAHYRPLFTFLAFTGCRYGEAEALTVGDVDLDTFVEIDDAGTLEARPTVRITKAAKWNATSATREVGPTKTKRSRRTVDLPPELVDILAPLIDGRASGERLFRAPRGGAIRHKPVWDVWVKACETAGIEPRPRIHDLRHTHVAWLLARGVSMSVIQYRLGHEHYSTTADVYGHLEPAMRQAAARAASLVFQASRAAEVGAVVSPPPELSP